MRIVNLQETKIKDRPHFLIWDTPDLVTLQEICLSNQAKLINYRENLLSRINASDRFLLLHQHIDRELNAIRDICYQSNHQVIIIQGLDYLITYLSVNANLSIFWQRLINLRQLKVLMWLLLPSKIITRQIPINRSIFLS